MNITYQSTKTYNHSAGLSCTFRQWKAKHSHCQYPHGYALKVKTIFEGPLDDKNWVIDFGGLKLLEKYLKFNFDHKWLVAKDDPALPLIINLQQAGAADLVIVDNVGCEAFAAMILIWVNDNIVSNDKRATLRVVSVEVSEHEGNSAIAINAG